MHQPPLRVRHGARLITMWRRQCWSSGGSVATAPHLPPCAVGQRCLGSSAAGQFHWTGTDSQEQALPRQSLWLYATVGVLAALSTKRKQDTVRAYERNFFDFYKLVEKQLGAGTYGTVRVAMHRETGEVVAVKMIPRREATAEEVALEVDILRLAGEHKNITQLTDFFWDGEYWYLVMEMAKGGELFDRLVNKGLLSEAQTVHVMRELAEAVAFLHVNGIIHGDIKPENVMLASPVESDVVEVRLGDFGSAVEAGAQGMFLTGQPLLTIAYSPPEVLLQSLMGEDDPATEISTKSDMYALGVLMYIMLSGKHPFDPHLDADDNEIMRRVVDENPDFEDPVWQEVSPKAVELLKKLLAKDPHNRPSADEMLRHPWFQSEQTDHSSSTPLEATECFQRFCSGRRQAKAALLAVMTGFADDPVSAGASSPRKGEKSDLVFGPRALGSRTAACKLMDTDGNGVISARDLQRTLRKIGEELGEKEVMSMMKAIDGDPHANVKHVTFAQMTRLLPPLCPARVYQPGEEIYREGEQDSTVYLIKKGRVEFSLGTPSGELTLQSLTPGDSFGEVELLGSDGVLRPRVCTSRCASQWSRSGAGRCELLAVPQNVFSLLTDVFTSVEGKIYAQAEARLHQICRSLLSRGFRHPDGRGELRLSKGAPVWAKPNLKSNSKSKSRTGDSQPVGPGGGRTSEGEHLQGQGQPRGDCAVVVLQGEVEVEYREGRRERLRAGDYTFCGDTFESFGNLESPERVMCVKDDSLVLQIPAQSVMDQMKKDNMTAVRNYLFREQAPQALPGV